MDNYAVQLLKNQLKNDVANIRELRKKVSKPMIDELIVMAKELRTGIKILEQKVGSGEKQCVLPDVMPSLLELNFRERRQKLKLNLRAVALRTNISAATILRIECGQMESQYKLVKKLHDWYISNGA